MENWWKEDLFWGRHSHESLATVNATCIFKYCKASIFSDALESELSTQQKCRRYSAYLIMRKDNPAARILQYRLFWYNSLYLYLCIHIIPVQFPVGKCKQNQCRATPLDEHEEVTGCQGRCPQSHFCCMCIPWKQTCLNPIALTWHWAQVKMPCH